MTAEEIRQKYLNFFKEKGHTIIPSASVLPENDPTTLFTSSGMQPLIPYLMGQPHPEGKRLADIQKSFRAGDIEEVGDNRHTTCFEMLGNWSLGDYFKKEQLEWFWEFLTKELGIDSKRLYATVFRGNDEINVARDEASVEIWKRIFSEAGTEAKDIDFAEKNGMQDGRIFYYDEEKNWWSRSGAPSNMPIGEIGGPDSEVFYDLGADLKRHENSKFKDLPCHVNCDCGRFIEIGNSVFIEFKKTETGFEPLAQKNVDFGGGLERIAMVVQGKTSIFDSDLYSGIIRRIEDLSGKKYKENIRAFEVIADHLKAASFIMADDKGVAPSNVDQGYIVRRLIRRAIRYGRILEIKNDLWAKEIAQKVIDDYNDVYPELERNKEFVLSSLDEEEKKFKKTLERGLKRIEALIKETIQKMESEIAQRILPRRRVKAINEVDVKKAFDIYQTYGFPLEMIQEELAKRMLLVDEGEFDEFEKKFQEEFKKHQELSRTASAGKFKGGLADAGEQTKKLHTAAHLLLAALKKVLGDEVVQRGSNINAERLRFDFSHSEKLTDEQKQKVEELINQAIKNDLPVKCEEMSLEQAKKQGATGVFESKYGERVKVYTIGDKEVFSKEICGGPHIDNTGELGRFKILKEESSSAGVRRIKAVLE